MKILKFTSQNSRNTVYANLDAIAMWLQSFHGSGTSIYLAGGPTVDVKETPEEVAAMIEQAFA